MNINKTLNSKISILLSPPSSHVSPISSISNEPSSSIPVPSFSQSSSYHPDWIGSFQFSPCPSRIVSKYSSNDIDEIEKSTLEYIMKVPQIVREAYDKHSFNPQNKQNWRHEIQPTREPEPFSAYENKRDSFAAIIPTMTCKNQKYFGGKTGPLALDGQRSVCDIDSFKKLHQDNPTQCVIYSLGMGGDLGFEKDCLKQTDCVIHIFDCTVTNRIEGPIDNSDRMFFHPWCVSHRDYKHTDNGKTMEFLTLTSIKNRLSHQRIDWLKTDIEGFEHEIFEKWRFNDDLPDFLSAEWHCTSSPVKNRYRRKALGEHALLILHLYHLGYRVVSKSFEQGGIEMSMLRLFCPLQKINI